ncbi:MAG: Nif11-like leader peptide family RiPP precursor [Clostridia bacterium]|nr:Nif11-like leader peptide family RiPP precursor [Clostridia bacterium]
MRGIEALKEKLRHDSVFRDKFANIKSTDEAISLAKEFGYDVSEEEVSQDAELNEDILEAVSGGKGKTKYTPVNLAIGEGSEIIVGDE